MTKKQKNITVGICIVLILGISIFITNKNKQDIQVVNSNNESQTNLQFVNTNTVQYSTTTKNNNTNNIELSQKKALVKILDEEFSVLIQTNTTVYDALKMLMDQKKINFEGRQYPVLGFFVTSINTLQSGNGKNLFYYINGIEANVGISSYVLKEGDVIEWILK